MTKVKVNVIYYRESEALPDMIRWFYLGYPPDELEIEKIEETKQE